jgi:hypothetical protein
MQAFIWLGSGATEQGSKGSVFTWPTPSETASGWVKMRGLLPPIRYAIGLENLPYGVSQELWELELSEPVSYERPEPEFRTLALVAIAFPGALYRKRPLGGLLRRGASF